MTIGTKAIIGLAAGLSAGAAIAASAVPALLAIGSAVEVGGTIWINAILMTILPLVVSKLVVSIAGHEDQRTVGRAGWKAAAWFLGLLIVTAVITAVVMPTIYAWLPMDQAALLRTKGPAVESGAPPTVAQVVLGLVPANAIRAAADGAIVPVLVFTVACAFGVSRIPRHLRDPLVTLFRSVDAAITVLLHWIVALAPYGVFGLGLGLAIHVGVGIVTALAYYIAVSSALLILFIAALYVVVFIGTGISPVRFARAAAPAQVVAF
ncbi:MAG: cation:dicarboxylase symporter family transporter, partial [Acidobacteria bacterium]|nr:cation:dicarboxylase symporter family transporter [Acidobacteriota bacterium]